jgi:hypothetical protein
MLGKSSTPLCLSLGGPTPGEWFASENPHSGELWQYFCLPYAAKCHYPQDSGLANTAASIRPCRRPGTLKVTGSKHGHTILLKESIYVRIRSAVHIGNGGTEEA